MNTSKPKLELHQIIDQGKGTSDNKPVTKEQLDTMLDASEEDINAGRLTDQSDIKKEITTWRKK
jgi:predicted transcriptional regulator